MRARRVQRVLATDSMRAGREKGMVLDRVAFYKGLQKREKLQRGKVHKKKTLKRKKRANAYKRFNGQSESID